jgi:hypothetical protein
MEHAGGIRVVSALRVTRCRPSSTPPWPVNRAGRRYRRRGAAGRAHVLVAAAAVALFVGVRRE